jgi:probable aminopeptidase NPEPL1
MATLTGAQAYATGKYHSAVLCNDEELENAVLKAGTKSGDLAHPLPYSPELHFAENLKSEVADMKNANLGTMTAPPSSVAGLFIGSHIDFASDVKWLHIDMAAPAFSSERSTAYGVSLISALLAKYCTDADVAK